MHSMNSRHTFYKLPLLVIFVLLAALFSTASNASKPTPAPEQEVPASQPETPVITNDSVPAVAPAPAPAPQLPAAVGLPIHISIPAINVSAKVLHIGLTGQGAVGVPEGAFDTSWFSAGTRPGQPGSAVISGHRGIWKDGTRSIFDNLPTLNIGDNIYIKDDAGITRTFNIKNTKIYGKNDTVPEIFNPADKAYLNIITCYGTWLAGQKTYDKRFVVFAELQ